MGNNNLLSLLKNTPVLILQTDTKGNILNVPLVDESLKSYKESLTGKTLEDIFLGDTLREFKANLKQASLTSTLQIVSFNLSIEDKLFEFKTYILPVKDNTILLAIHNITYYKTIEEKNQRHNDILQEYKQLLSIFDSIDNIIYVTDMDTYEILYANKTLQDRFDHPVIGKLCYKEFQGLDSPCPFCTNNIIRNNNYQPHYWEFYNKLLKGYFHITDRVIKWPDGRDVRFELAVDITKQKMLEKELKILATTDELTGLWNRRHFIHQGNHEFERALRYDTPFSLILLDIDRFKNINDTYGHLAGDTVMKKITRTILNNLRELDICARIGGDEFGIILPNTDISGALTLAERLRTAISEKPIRYETVRINTTVSIGITEYNKEFTAFEDMLKIADRALYEAKQKGRNITVSKQL
ncbi:MAG TPA: GGDEF domain-containing protein [bacterium]|nr:GGDEF domain-containing protein [bacterium]HPP29890.1 GGDEF domain-containing protein [bacterium]